MCIPIALSSSSSSDAGKDLEAERFLSGCGYKPKNMHKIGYTSTVCNSGLLPWQLTAERLHCRLPHLFPFGLVVQLFSFFVLLLLGQESEDISPKGVDVLE